MLKKIIVASILFLLMPGCFLFESSYKVTNEELKVEPDLLPKAIVGKPYFVTLKLPNFYIRPVTVDLIERYMNLEQGLEICIFTTPDPYKRQNNNNKNSSDLNPGEKKCHLVLKTSNEFLRVERTTTIDNIEDNYNHVTISGTPIQAGYLPVRITYDDTRGSGKYHRGSIYSTQRVIVIEDKDKEAKEKKRKQ